MTYRITKEHVWVGAIPDRADALAEKLRALRDGGLNLELILARRAGAGHGLLFVAPLRTLEEITAVETAGLVRSATMKTIRIEGPNVAGLGAKITTALAEAGLNIREYAAAALGDRCVTNIAFDNDAEGDRARELLLKVLA
jgi:hypothetical protein